MAAHTRKNSAQKSPAPSAGLSLALEGGNHFYWPAGFSVEGFASPWFCCAAGCVFAGSTLVVPGATGFWFSVLK